MRRNHQFLAGIFSVPVPPEGRPEGCPETIDIDLGTLTVSWVEPDDPLPNWPAFREAIQHSDALLRIANVNAARFVLVNTVMWQIATQPSLIPELVSNWNALAIEAQPTPTEIAELNGIASDNNIPFLLDDQGLMG